MQSSRKIIRDEASFHNINLSTLTALLNMNKIGSWSYVKKPEV